MTILQPNDIATYAKKAGFTGEGLVIATAIALAESGGNTEAQGQNGPTDGCPNGSLDRGLFQINNCYHPDVSDLCAYNPQCNADKAYAISNNGVNFHPWSTFLNGAYLQHMETAKQAVDSLQQQIEPSQDAANQISALERDVHNRLQLVESDIAELKNTPQTETNGVPQHYHVIQGDTLWGIAVKFYHNGNEFNRIYEANKGTIGNNPNTIKAGMVLVIP